jgi:hypothetical protein
VVYAVFFILSSPPSYVQILSSAPCSQTPPVDSKGFWRWCTTHGINRFLDFVHCPVFYRLPFLSHFHVCACFITTFIVHFPVISHWQSLVSGIYIAVVILTQDVQ